MALLKTSDDRGFQIWYLCKVCSRVFTQAKELISHKKLIHGIRKKKKRGPPATNVDVTVAAQASTSIINPLVENNNGSSTAPPPKSGLKVTYLDLSEPTTEGESIGGNEFKDKDQSSSSGIGGQPSSNKISISARTGTKESGVEITPEVLSKSSSPSSSLTSPNPNGPNSCPQCGKRFQNQSFLKLHMNSHSQTKSYFVCDVCQSRFPLQFALVRHKKNVHGDHHDHGPPNQHNIGQMDLKLGQGQKEHKCQFCCKSYKHKGNLSTHVINSHNQHKTPACQFCSKRFKLKSTLAIHIDKYHGNEEFKCKQCHQCFDDQSRLIAHMKHHSVKKKKTSSVSPRKYCCVECGKYCSYESCLKQHMQSHSRVKRFRFRCLACSSSFIQKCSLTGHMKSAHGNKSIQRRPNKSNVTDNTDDFILCNLCNQCFQHRCALKAHMKSHLISGPSGVSQKSYLNTPFQCPNCGRYFRSKFLLKNHIIRFSAGKKRYSCSTCPKSFATSNELEIHVMSHTGEKPFKCTICHKAFAVKTRLQLHLDAIHSSN